MLKGSCQCGAVHYEVARLGVVVMCHCSKCRKANGTAFATNSPIEASDFRLLKGADAIKEYESSPGVFRVFCGTCASPLYSRRPAHPNMLRLRIGTLDTPIDSKPSMHIYVGSKAEWEEIHDDLPKHEDRPPL
jgi:hypothetical protein